MSISNIDTSYFFGGGVVLEAFEELKKIMESTMINEMMQPPGAR